MSQQMQTFIVDCHICQAKVAAQQSGSAERSFFDDEVGEPFCERVLVGKCPNCDCVLVGSTQQIGFEKHDSEIDIWSDVVRVYPKPPKVFSSMRIPRVVTTSLNEADRSLQAGANIAACVMFGRALEALCRHVISTKQPAPPDREDTSANKKPQKKLMLGEGIRKLHELKVIDDRLLDWSQQLQAFRNLAAHPEDISISRVDAEDLQTFVNAIVEYVYDLSDRYDEFKGRLGKSTSRKLT